MHHTLGVLALSLALNVQQRYVKLLIVVCVTRHKVSASWSV